MSLPLYQCQQCGHLFLELHGGRCSACRNRTTAEVFASLHGDARDVQSDAFHAPKDKAALVSTLLPVEEADRIIGKMNMGEGRTLTYVQTNAGLIGRYEFQINSENMPSKEEIYSTLAKRKLSS